MSHASDQFTSLNISILTVSDTRTEETDTGGNTLRELVEEAGHKVHEKQILADNTYALRALVSAWIANEEVNAILLTGGTGLTGRDVTPEAISPLFDKEIEGFGELFRWLSWQEIGTSTLQSRALAGTANGTFIFCLPGSPGACRTAWNEIIRHQLDSTTTPCNMVALMPRLREQ